MPRPCGITRALWKIGPDAAQVILGHKHLKTTEIYSVADREKAAAVAREVG
ncbi:MAG TPA: hypothetical protein VMP01_03035 [Pirellulaceae bacterium]|nr:hypothetical protein [Pirellulaceae bacterium]